MTGKVLGAAFLGVFLVACQTVQQTGRTQFIIVPDSQELQLGQDAYKETLDKNRLSTRSDWQAQLRRVASLGTHPRIQSGTHRLNLNGEGRL